MQKFKHNVFDEKYNNDSSWLIPSGRYRAEVTVAEIRPSKANLAGVNESENLYIEYDIIQKGEHLGKMMREWMAINNPNETAEDIARRKLQSLANALGIDGLAGPDELFKIPFILDIGQKKDPKYGIQNTILKYCIDEKPSDIENTTEEKKDEKDEKDFDDDIPF